LKNVLRRSTRPAIIALLAFTAGLTTIHASIIQADATLPPPGGVYTLAPSCVAVACVGDIRVSGFNNTSVAIVPPAPGDEVVQATAVLNANVFQNAGGSPGTLLGPLALNGTMDFTYFGRNFSTPTGTFNAEITAFDFFGIFAGHTVEVKNNPGSPSTGQTTITPLGPGGPFEVSSFFDVFAELSIDGGPFIPGPPHHTVLSAAVPEPGSSGLAVFGLMGLAGFAWRGRRRAA